MGDAKLNTPFKGTYYFTKNKPSFLWVTLICILCLLFSFFIFPSMPCEIQYKWNAIIQPCLALTTGYIVSYLFYYINIYKESENNENDCISCIARILFQLKIAQKKLNLDYTKNTEALGIFIDDDAMFNFNSYFEVLINPLKVIASKLSSNIVIVVKQLDLTLNKCKEMSKVIKTKSNSHEEIRKELNMRYSYTVKEIEKIIFSISHVYDDGEEVMQKVNQEVIRLSELKVTSI